jgi:hypothetical protein
MAPLPRNPVRLYNTLKDLATSAPYATEDADELELVIYRFVTWAQMIATRPSIAAQFGDRSRDPIQLATVLRRAMESRRHRNVVLPMSTYFAAKLLAEITNSVAKEPVFIEMMERENLLWSEDSYSYQI